MKIFFYIVKVINNVTNFNNEKMDMTRASRLSVTFAYNKNFITNIYYYISVLFLIYFYISYVSFIFKYITYKNHLMRNMFLLYKTFYIFIFLYIKKTLNKFNKK